MTRVFITGSSDGLGLMAAKLLAEWGHQVTLHARNDARVDDARRALPQAEAVAVGDLSSIAQMRQVAEQANALGKYHAVIHNVGVGYREPRRIETADGLSHVFTINDAGRQCRCRVASKPEEYHRECRAQCPRRDLTVGSKFCVQPWQCQRRGNRSSSDRSEQITLEFWPRSDLASSDQRK